MSMQSVKQNWFETLAASLESENLLGTFPIGASIGYGEIFRYTHHDGSEHGRLVSITRNSNGKYERPVHYQK